jgi:uncharacterized protein YndB with AHSA1/START domain
MTTTQPPVTPSTADATLRVEEHTVLREPRSRVWRALTTSHELGAWFGVNLPEQPITPGAQLIGNFLFPGYEHMQFDVIITEMVPEERFAWRWHPHAAEIGVDYSAEPRTLVTFTLEDTESGGTLLRVVETGFEALSPDRRTTAVHSVSKGWTGQLTKRLPAYLAAN